MAPYDRVHLVKEDQVEEEAEAIQKKVEEFS
jgi:hypothetical protein